MVLFGALLWTSLEWMERCEEVIGTNQYMFVELLLPALDEIDRVARLSDVLSC